MILNNYVCPLNDSCGSESLKIFKLPGVACQSIIVLQYKAKMYFVPCDNTKSFFMENMIPYLQISEFTKYMNIYNYLWIFSQLFFIWIHRELFNKYNSNLNSWSLLWISRISGYNSKLNIPWRNTTKQAQFKVLS